VPPFVMEIEEVYHAPETKAVDQVSHCPCKDEGEAEGGPQVPLFDPAEIIEDEDHGHKRDDDKEVGETLAVCHQAKGGPPVQYMGDVQDPLDGLPGLMEGEMALDIELAPLIQGEEEDKDNQ